MKNALSTAALVLLVSVSARAQNAMPNFSGTWTLDLAKSDFGPAPPPDSVVMTIDHKEPSLKSTTVQKGQQGDAANESTITTDGKENVNRLRAAGMEQDVKSTSKWNGKRLTTERGFEIQGMSIGMNDAWELSDDGKVLTIVREINTPQGSFSTRMAFNKQ
ncbi:MAG: hypothetical protein HY048_10125 [Acidobacteria bacterium]|nr:hypothetical protein [Acidobacteriota bacterium]